VHKVTEGPLLEQPVVPGTTETDFVFNLMQILAFEEFRRTMTDQTLPHTSGMGKAALQKARPDYSVLYKLAWRWRAFCCWARYLMVGSRPAVPQLVDFVVGNYLFGAIQVPDELEALGNILFARCPKRALEIGTAKGGTLFFLTRLASPDATIVSIDLPDGQFGGGYTDRRRWSYQRFARRGQRLHLLQGNSHSLEMLSRVKGALAGQPLDYLFIDGDHSYEGVKSDFEMYGPLVRKGGLIAFHDIAEGKPEAVGGVPQLWRQIKPRYRSREVIQDPRQGGCGIGLLYIDQIICPSATAQVI
jgi:predicted O-methyltransferase YrrM